MTSKDTVTGVLIGGSVLVPSESEANSLYQKGFYGEMKSGGKLSLSLVEAVYLISKSRLSVKKAPNARKELSFEEMLKLAEKEDSHVASTYRAYCDLRERGYLVKTGFKFGTHFRLYNRGDIPGQAHSAVLVHAIPETSPMTMTELSRMVRLGHSVRKKIWLAAVDNEGDVTYYELGRMTP